MVATLKANLPAVSLPLNAPEDCDPPHPEVLVQNDLYRMRRCRHGWMLFLKSDIYIGRSLDIYGEYSEAENALFRQLLKPGHVVVEAGANIGAHTVFLARAVGSEGAVHAIEPQRVLHQILCANAALNGFDNVFAYNMAVGREVGEVVVPRIDYSKPANFGGLEVNKFSSGDVVQMDTIDSLGLTSCNFIKIDVEGMEGEVIAGAEQTIRRNRPLLYLENDRKDKSALIIRQLFDLDYRLYWHLPPLFNPNNYFKATQNEFGAIISVNMLAVPKERYMTLSRFQQITDPHDDWRDC